MVRRILPNPNRCPFNRLSLFEHPAFPGCAVPRKVVKIIAASFAQPFLFIFIHSVPFTQMRLLTECQPLQNNALLLDRSAEASGIPSEGPLMIRTSGAEVAPLPAVLVMYFVAFTGRQVQPSYSSASCGSS